VSMEWTGDTSSRWRTARKAFSSWRLSKWKWQVWCHSFKGVAGKWRFPRDVKQHIKQHYLNEENKIRWRWPWWWGEPCEQYRLRLLHLWEMKEAANTMLNICITIEFYIPSI
jgi:hypothetical protein